MPIIQPGGKVLVTGANGFIAVWVVQDLLEHGYSVRGTVRSEDKAEHVKSLFAKFGEKFEVVIVPDITQEGAFDAAVQGVDAIEHTASPFHFNADDPNELIGPAVKGTTGILGSALKHAGSQLKRVVVLSSCASVFQLSDVGILNESNWNEQAIQEVEAMGKEASQPAKYRASKCLAEKAAWAFYEDKKKTLSWDLVTLCPPYVFGPVIHEVSSPSELNTSSKDWFTTIFKNTKTAEFLSTFQNSWVDVRDLSLAHVKALEVPEAGGNRFIISSGNFAWQDWFDSTNKLGLPGVTAPIGDPGLGERTTFKQIYDTSKSRNVLGIQYRDKLTTTRDSIDNFRAKGWLA